jgi:hypothetical protein
MVSRIVHGVRRALFVGQPGRTGADRDEHFFLFRRHLGHGQAGAGIGAADQHVDTLLVEPFARFRGGNIGLVLVVSGNELDFFSSDYHAGIGNGHFDGLGATGTVDVGVEAGHVGNHADLDGVAGNLRVRPIRQA